MRSQISVLQKYQALIIISIVLVSSFLLYLPFALHLPSIFALKIENSGLNYIYQSYDGLYYVVAAKSFYLPKAIEAMQLEFTQPLEYYAAHLPLYPIFISLFAIVLGYLKSMIFVNLLFTVCLALLFAYIVKVFKLTEKPLLLTIALLFLPRFLIVRSVGAPESLFMFLIIGSIYFFEKKNYWLAGLIGALATATKTPGILLFGAYGLVFLEQMIRGKKIQLNWFGIGLIPLGLIAVFSLYAMQYGDFWAYFNTGGVVPMPYIFSVFNYQERWIGTPWLEEIMLYFFLYGLAVFHLKDSQYRSLFYFPLIFLIAASFVQHRDLSRYMLPLWPFACIAFEKVFTSKKFMILLLILLPALYLYAWNFLLYNIIPVSDWKAFL